MSRFQGWLREQAFQMTRSRCPWCGASPVRSEAEMVVFTNSGYHFPEVALTYCLMCEQLLYAELVEQPEPCRCHAHVESDIAESDTLPLRNPHRITDIVFDSCARCGQVLDCSIHY
jgi:hypothetical protein